MSDYGELMNDRFGVSLAIGDKVIYSTPRRYGYGTKNIVRVERF
jgi:hypothetical protein